MNPIQSFFARLAGTENLEQRIKAEIDKRDWETPVIEAWRSNRESAGSSVTPDSALRMSAVFACARIASETVASIPLHFYERLAKGKRESGEYYLYRLFKDGPNPDMTGFEYIELIQAYIELWGKGYSRVVYDGFSGHVMELWPLHPRDLLQTQKKNGVKYFQFVDENGKTVWYSQDQIWQVNGFMGLSPIALHRRAVGLGLDAEEFGARFFSNDARPGIAIEHPKTLSKVAHDNLKADIEEEHKGVSKSHKVMILEEGMKIHEIGIPPEDAQFIETRKFQIQEIARIYRIPPHMLADLDRATFSNIEEQSIEFVKYSILPRVNRWERSILKFLELPGEKDKYYPEFLIAGLERGNIVSRYQSYAVARQNGWMNADEIRERENMNPMPNGQGQVYLVPLNMIPADQVGNEPAPPPASRDWHDPEPETREHVEQRGRQAAIYRQRLAGRYAPAFGRVAGSILRSERSDVLNQARQMIPAGELSQFEYWLNRYYERRKPKVAGEILPTAEVYAEAIAKAVRDEIGGEDLIGHLDEFLRAYAHEFGVKMSDRSLVRLLEKIRSMKEASREEVLAAVEAQLDDWVDNRPEQIGHEESVRENNAVAVALYGIAGVRTLMSVARGASNCPFCKSLDGKVIGIQQYFLTQGQVLNPDGAQAPMNITHNMRHSPYHDGCDCQVVAGG